MITAFDYIPDHADSLLYVWGKDLVEGSYAQEMYNAAGRLVRKVPERGDAPLLTSCLSVHPDKHSQPLMTIFTYLEVFEHSIERPHCLFALP